MKRFEYRVWDKNEKVMITGEEVLKNLYYYLQAERYILMESVGDCDKKGQLIFEGDYVAQQERSERGVFRYAIKEIQYDEEKCRLESYSLKSRIVINEKWFEKEDCISISKYDVNGEVIGNRYEHPEAVEKFQPNYKDITESTGWVDKFGNEIYEYHVLLAPNGLTYVVEYNENYAYNQNTYFLRHFQSSDYHQYIDTLLNEDFAKKCQIVSHAFFDNQRKKVNA